MMTVELCFSMNSLEYAYEDHSDKV